MNDHRTEADFIKPCAVCAEKADKCCSSCGSVSYCSVEHQKEDWKTHKLTCSPFIVKDAPDEITSGGKISVASRDLKAGTVLLKELPLFQMPPEHFEVCCISCSSPLPGCNWPLPSVIKRSSSNCCKKCNWPVCDEECSKLPIHADNECKVFKANKIPYPLFRKNGSKEGLRIYPLMFRAYGVMNQDKTKWKKLMEFTQWNFKGKEAENMLKAENTSYFPLLPDARFEETEEWMLELIKSIQTVGRTHGFELIAQFLESPEDANSSNCKGWKAKFIYSKASHFTHSCAPNCEWKIGKFPHYKFILRTSVPVKKGEILTLSRLAFTPKFDWGTLKRQVLFKVVFETVCKCKLCMDPTEFGTYQSAVVCKSCLNPGSKTDTDHNLGYLLPINPSDISENAPWKCNKCSQVKLVSEFIPQIDEISTKFENQLNMQYYKEKNVADLKTYLKGQLEKLTSKYSNKLVHPNHWILQRVVRLCRWMLLRLIEGNESRTSKADWLEFEKYSMYLLNIQNKTMVGLQVVRVVNVSVVSKAIISRIVCGLSDLLGKSVPELKKLREEVLMIIQFQKEATAYVRDEFFLRVGDVEFSGDEANPTMKFRSIVHLVKEFLGNIDQAIALKTMEGLQLVGRS